jgi:hypothetical protein
VGQAEVAVEGGRGQHLDQSVLDVLKVVPQHVSNLEMVQSGKKSTTSTFCFCFQIKCF